jgi:HlyD family secretion protein
MNTRRIAALLFAASLLAACGSQSNPGFQGWVEADLIFVGPDEPGRIETLNVREGDSVERNAELFTLDAELQRADLAQAEASLTNTRLAFQRAETLLKASAGTQRSYEEAEAAVRAAQARFNSAQTQLARRKVASPVKGVVQQVYFRVGEMVTAARPVVALLPPGNVKLRFFVPEAVLPKIAIGQDLRVTCDGCPPNLIAKLSFISRSAEFTPPVIYSTEERSKLVFMIEARPSEPDKLRVGQPVSIHAEGLP